MDDTIHVEIQTIELRNSVLRYQLRNRWISFAHPSEKLRYTHDERWGALDRRRGVNNSSYLDYKLVWIG